MRYPAPPPSQYNQGNLSANSATPVIPKINKKTKTLQQHNPKSLQPNHPSKFQVGNNVIKETAKIEKHLNDEEQKLKMKKQREQEDITNTKLQQLYQKFKEIEALSQKQREIEQNCTKVFSMNRSHGKSYN